LGTAGRWSSGWFSNEALERALADRIMQPGRRHEIRQLQPGDYLFRQGEQATSIALVLDGMFEVRVDERVVGQVGPGTVVGERAQLEGGRRTADVRATTEARIAEVDGGSLDLELLRELAQGHHRDETL
jgi:CRP-like cAMP-binding protein